MKIYELYKEYPESPKLGFIVNSSNSNYYKHHPEKWPEFWKEVKQKEVLCVTYEGDEIRKGDEYYFLQSEGNIVNTTAYHSLEFNNPIFSKLENAQEYKIKSINLEIENETIKGEDIILYGVCNKANWQTCETTSVKLFYRNTKSESWKYFRTPEERENYVFENKPRFSVKDILNINHDTRNLDFKHFINFIKVNYKI